MSITPVEVCQISRGTDGQIGIFQGGKYFLLSHEMAEQMARKILSLLDEARMEFPMQEEPYK